MTKSWVNIARSITYKATLSLYVQRKTLYGVVSQLRKHIMMITTEAERAGRLVPEPSSTAAALRLSASNMYKPQSTNAKPQLLHEASQSARKYRSRSHARPLNWVYLPISTGIHLYIRDQTEVIDSCSGYGDAPPLPLLLCSAIDYLKENPQNFWINPIY